MVAQYSHDSMHIPMFYTIHIYCAGNHYKVPDSLGLQTEVGLNIPLLSCLGLWDDGTEGGFPANGTAGGLNAEEYVCCFLVRS